jgi:hypothetical protein
MKGFTIQVGAQLVACSSGAAMGRGRAMRPAFWRRSRCVERPRGTECAAGPVVLHAIRCLASWDSPPRHL